MKYLYPIVYMYNSLSLRFNQVNKSTNPYRGLAMQQQQYTRSHYYSIIITANGCKGFPGAWLRPTEAPIYI